MPINRILPGRSGGPATVSVYHLAGGDEAFRHLVHEFYGRVYADPLLRPMFPDDRAAAEERLSLFLIQYFGGPATYSEQRGHPRLRMRHLPFAIGPAERDAWLAHMRVAVDELELPPLYEAELWDYLVRAAHSMVNSE